MSDLFDKFVFDLQRFDTGTYAQIASGALSWASGKLLEINGSPSDATFEYEGSASAITSITSVTLTADGTYQLATAKADKIYTKQNTTALFIGGGDSANHYFFKNTSGNAYFVGGGNAPTAFDFGVGDAFQLGLLEDPYEGHANLLDTDKLTYNEGANKLSELVTSDIDTGGGIAQGDNKWLTRTGTNEFTFSGLAASDDNEDYLEIASSGDGYFGITGSGSASLTLNTETKNISKVELDEGLTARIGGTSAVVVAINGASVQTNATYFYYKYGSASSALYLYDPSDGSAEDGVPDNVVIKYAGDATEVHAGNTDAGGFSGTFQIGENGTVFTVNDTNTFMFNVKNNVATGVSGIGDGDQISGAFFANGGFSLNGNAVTVTNNGASSTTEYTFYGTSLAGLVNGDNVTASGLSIFGTSAIATKAEFVINGTSMAVNGNDADGVQFTLNASNSLAAVDGLSSTAYLTGDFTNTGGISVNGTTVEVTGDSSIDVYGGENAITKIAGLSGTVDVVSASGVEQVGADGDGTFTFSFAQSGLSFAVDGNGTEQTWFGFSGTSVTAISGVDTGEKVTGNFEAGITVNESDKEIKVTSDPDLIVTNLGDALGISGLTNGAVVESAGGVTEITTDAIEATAGASFTFKTGSASQAFSVANGSGDADGVTFLLGDSGAVNGISSFDFGDTITGAFGGQSFTFSGTSGTTSVEAKLHITGVSGTFDVVHDDFEVRNLATGATINYADNFINVFSLSLAAGASYVITDHSGNAFTVTAGAADANGVQFILDGAVGNILGVSSLEQGSTLEGGLSVLTEGINGLNIDIVDSDNSFGVVGAASGISVVFNVSASAMINSAAGASQIITDNDGTFYFKGNGTEVTLGGGSAVFLIDSTSESAVLTGVEGLSTTDSYLAADNAIFNGDFTANGQSVAISGDDNDLRVYGNAGASALSKITNVGGESVVISNAGGASLLITDTIGTFTFGEGGQSFVTGGADSSVEFALNELTVEGISAIGEGEWVQGDFSGVTTVNGLSFQIDDDPDSSLKVYGSTAGLSMIAEVGNGATVLYTASAPIVETNDNGTFKFGGGQSFIISNDGDSSVQFLMDTAAQSAAVLGIDKFNVASGQSGYIEGKLSGIDINKSGTSIAVEGDADKIFQYIIDENGQTILGGVGASSATDTVVITGTGGASIVRIINSGIYQFGSQSFELNMDAEGSGESAYVDFYVNGSGSDLTVTKIDSFDKGDWVRGDFQASAISFAGMANGAESTAVVQVLGDSSVVVEHDDFLLKEISNGATIVSADGISVAWTDPITAAGLSVVDADNYQFTVTGGSQSVAFLLDGQGHINGISALAAEQTLVGSQSALESFTETGFNGLSVVVSGDPNGFGVVGSGSGADGDGITSIINLTGGASVEKAGSASYAYTDSDGTFTFTNAQSGIAISGDSAVQFIFTDNNINAADVGGVSQFDGWLTADANFFNDFTVNGQSVIIKNDANDMSVLGISGVGIGAISKVGPANSAYGASGVQVIDAGSASYITTDKTGGFSFVTSGQEFMLFGGDSEITFGLSNGKVTAIDDFAKAGESQAVILGPLNGIPINGNSAIDVTVNGDSAIKLAYGPYDGATYLAAYPIEGASAVVVNNAGGASYFATYNEGTFKFAGNSAPFSLAGDSGVLFELVPGDPATAAGVSYFGMTDPPTNTMAGISATISGYLNEFTKGINNSGQSIAITGDKDSIFSYAVDDVGVGTGEHATLGMVAPEDNGLVEVNGLGGASVLEIVGGGSYEFFGDKTFTYASDSAFETFSGDSVAQFVLNGETVTQINSFDQGDTVTGDFSDKIEFNSGSGIVQVTGDGDSSIVVTNAGDGFILYDLDNGATFGASAVVGVKEAWTDELNAAQSSIAVTDAVGNSFTVSGEDADGVKFIVNKETGAIEGVSSLDQGVTLAGALGALNVINGNMFDIKGDSSFVVVGSEGASGIGAIYGLGSASGVTINYAGGASLIYTDMESAFYFKQGGDSATVGITLGTDEGWEGTEPNKSAVFSLDPDEDSYAIGVSGLNFESNYVQADHSVFEDPDGEHVGFTVNGKSVVIEGDEDDLVVYALSAAIDGVGIQVIANVGSTSEAGVTIVDMGGASFLITDKPGKLTFGEGGTEFTIGGDSYVGFYIENGGTSVTEIAGLDEAGWVESTALSSLEGINNVKFDIQNDVGAMRVYGKGASSLEDWDDLDGIWENEWGNGITKITKVGNADDVVTVNDAAGATTIETDVNGDFYFATKGQSFYVEDTVDSSVQFIMDGSQSAFVTGIEGLSEGKIIFNTATSALDVNTIQYPAQKMTFGTTSSVTLTVDPYQVVEVNGITAGGYVSGVVGNGKDATVWAEGPVSVNGTAIDITDSDRDYGILVSSESSTEEGTPYGAFGVTGDATVKVADFTVTADGDGEFLVGSESYTFEDGDQVFGFQTGSASEMTAVTSLDGSLVDYDGDVYLTGFNGDDVKITGNEGEPVTLGGDSYHLTSVDGLQDGASIDGDLENASIVMAADTLVGDTVPVTLTVNGNVYKLYDDDDGVTIVGADKDGYGKIMGLADGASMQVALGGVYTVNQTDGSDATTVFSGSDTVPAGGIIIGTENGNSAYLYDPNNVLIRKKTPLEEIQRITGIPTEGYSSIGGPSDLTKAHTPTDDGPLNISESDVIQGFQSASSADTLYPYVTRRDEYNDTLDLDQPLEIWIDNKESPVETIQKLDLSDNRYAKKVHMFEGTQSVEFNNDGGNLAHIESVASGKKNITLGDGGDVVVMDEPDAIQNAVSIIGGAGADSIFVREGANTTFDASEGGADKIITYAGAGARVTVVGYQASTAAGIKVDELPAENIFEAIAGTPTANPYISFGDGVVSITHPSYDQHSEVSIGSNDGASFVNIYNHKNTVQSVGFTGPDGGTLDVQNETDPLILVGNYKGEKENGSVILGGSGPDSILAGAMDSVDAKGGNNLVILEDNAERGGAVIAFTQGRTVVYGMNNTLAASTGDTIVLSANNIKNFLFDGEDVTIDGNGFYGILENVDQGEEDNYVTQYIYNSDNSTVYKAAGAVANGTIYLPKDEDVRPNAFFGMNSGIDFGNYADPQTVMIDLKGDMRESSIGGSPIYTKGITKLYGSDTTATLIFKGSDANETLTAGRGMTSLYGDGGKNLLVGSYYGSDVESEKEGYTTFFVIGNANGAANTISNFEYVSDDNYKDTSRVTADEIEILEDQSEVVYADMSGDDVYIEVASYGRENKESVVLKDAIDSDGYGKDFRISGNVAQVGHDKVKVDRFAEFYMATEKNATINVKEEGSPITVWLDNPETGKTFRGDFAVIDATGTTSNAQLAGLGSKENTIIAGDGNTSLWGGEGSSNDMLIGGAGKDNFYYGLGNGQDIISNAGDGDTVVLGLSIDDLIENECSVTDTTVYLKLKDGGDLTVIGSGTVDFKINNSEGVQETYYRDSNGSFKQR